MSGWRIGLIAISLLWIGGCGIPAAPVDLIKPPLTEGNVPNDQKSMNLRSLLPKGARVVASEDGKGSNGISYGDLDGDGIDEAVVVYEENVLQKKILKAALLRQQNDEWRIVWRTNGFGYGLDYVGTADVNEDGRPEIILGWSLGAGSNGLEIYEWNNDTLKLMDKKGYIGHFDLNDLP